MKYQVTLMLFLFAFALKAQTTVNGLITSNTTWTVSNSPYEVTGNVTVQTGATLTIEAGVVIDFPVYSVDVIIEGTLVAVGTSMNPIVFNGPGGIDLSENSAGSQVQHVEYNGVGATSTGSTDNTFGAGISIGGSVSSFTNVTFDNCRTCLVVYNGATPTIDDNSFNGSSAAALTVIEGSPVITNNTFDNHTLYGVELREGTPTLQNNTISNSGTALYLNGVLDDPVIENNTFTDNTTEIITHPELLDDELYDGNGFSVIYVNARTINNSTTWHKVEGAETWFFQGLGVISTATGVTLTMEPGFEITMTNYTHDIEVQGTLLANGTASDSIKIVGPGGIDLNENSNNSQVSYLRYEGVGATSGGSADRTLGGGLSIGGSNATITNSSFINTMHGLVVYNDATPVITASTFDDSHLAALISRPGDPTVTNCEFVNHGYRAVELRDGSGTLQNNMFSDNGVALFIDGILSSPTIEGNSFSGNTTEIITHPELLDDELYDGNGFTTIYVNARTISNSTTWHKVEGSEAWQFVGLGRIPTANGVTLTMEPGFEITMTNYTHDIEVEGTLIANGTESDSIKIHGPGGLDISTNSIDSEVSYFRYEGVGATSGGSSDRTFGGGLSVGGSNATITNSSFINSAIAIAIHNNASPSISNCEVATTAFQGISVSNGTSSPVIENVCFSNTGFRALENLGTGSVTAINNWWGDSTGPFNATSNPSGTGLEVGDGVTFDPWLTVNPCAPPEISIDTQPVAQTVCEGEDVIFSILASGAENLQYQWQEDTDSGFADLTDNTVYSGVHSADLTIFSVVGTLNLNNYRCIVSGDDADDVISESVSLEVTSLAAITDQPSGADITLGEAVTFSIVATGDDLSYQWQKDGIDIAGAIAHELSIASAEETDEGTYRCTLSNDCNVIISSEASLSVCTPVAITAQSTASVELCEGSDNTMSVSVDGDETITFEWFKDDVLIAGESGASYILTNLALDDAASYEVVVTNACGTAAATFDLAVVANPTIVSQPEGQLVEVGETAVFSVVADGEDLSYQWRKDGVAIAGETLSELMITSATDGDEGAYSCLVSNNCGSILSAAVDLSVCKPVTILDQSATVVTRCAGESITFSITDQGEAVISYEWYKDDVAIADVSSSFYELTDLATADAGEYRVVATNECGMAAASFDLSVLADPAITSQPESETIGIGESVTLTIEANGDNLAYQWQKDEQDIAEATGSSFSISNSEVGDSGSYRCVVTNDCGMQISQSALVAVEEVTLSLDQIDLVIYPNPSYGELYIQGLPTDQLVKVAFLDVSGKSVRELPTSKAAEKIDISSLEPGVYWVIIYQDEMTLQSQRIVLK